MVYFILLNRNLLCSKYVCSKFNTMSVHTHTLGCLKMGQYLWIRLRLLPEIFIFIRPRVLVIFFRIYMAFCLSLMYGIVTLGWTDELCGISKLERSKNEEILLRQALSNFKQTRQRQSRPVSSNSKWLIIFYRQQRQQLNPIQTLNLFSDDFANVAVLRFPTFYLWTM